MTAKCSDSTGSALGRNGDHGNTQERIVILVSSLILALNCPSRALPYDLGGTDQGVVHWRSLGNYNSLGGQVVE